jgi:hypothetical protein
MRSRLAVVGVVLAAVAAVGTGSVAAARDQAATKELTAFAAKVDAACVRSWVRVGALEDPDGVGGQKPLGLGAAMETWVADMAEVDAPNAIAHEWERALKLLRRAGTRLADAERLAAQGRADASGAAQSEALWSLEARAAKIIAKLHVPFRACFRE